MSSDVSETSDDSSEQLLLVSIDALLGVCLLLSADVIIGCVGCGCRMSVGEMYC